MRLSVVTFLAGLLASGATTTTTVRDATLRALTGTIQTGDGERICVEAICGDAEGRVVILRHCGEPTCIAAIVWQQNGDAWTYFAALRRFSRMHLADTAWTQGEEPWASHVPHLSPGQLANAVCGPRPEGARFTPTSPPSTRDSDALALSLLVERCYDSPQSQNSHPPPWEMEINPRSARGR